MRACVWALAILIPLSTLASAAPFDMSGERPAGTEEKPARKADPAPAVVPKVVEPAPAPIQAQARLRYLVPFQTLQLTGEIAARTWSVYLTPAEAAAARRISYGYRNAILVAPESSTISVYVNDTLVGESSVQSPNGVSDRSFDLPRELLKPGANKISFRAKLQHRTDCSVQSTYELWSEIIPEKTFLTLDQPAEPTTGGIEDVKAVGVDRQGRTRFDIVAPNFQQQNQTDVLMRLAQGLAILGRMPNQSFTIGSTLTHKRVPGELTVVVGTAADLAPLLPALPQAAKSGTFSGFVGTGDADDQMLVLSGPTWQSVEAAVNDLVRPLERPQDIQRDFLWTQSWTGSDTPFIRSATNLTFAKLGVPTTEFSGRRFRTGFDIGVPADFYANAYGEARIMLDAAFSDDVLPGSHIDVYVNGNIASTLPITSSVGGIFRHLPIRVTMRHFRPGLNRIEIEAVLSTKGDLACVPGGTAPAAPRFALFDTSEFRIPDFARIGQLPGLAAVAGTAFPYGRDTKNISLFMDRVDGPTLSTAATFLGKLAVAAGRPVVTVSETSTARIGDNNAIFVGAVSQIPPVALDQVHITEAARTAWGNKSADITQGGDSKTAFDEWKTRVRGGTWQGQVTAFEEWLEDTFDISFGSLQFLPAQEVDNLPGNASTFLAAQGISPNETGTWTVLSSPDASELQQGMTYLSDEQNWQKMSGHLVLFDRAKNAITSQPSSRTYLIETQPFSIANYRLIAANWLSTNILSYAMIFAGAAVVLGLATSRLLNAFGRRK